MPVAIQQNSAAGLLALLAEDDAPEVQTYALEQLNAVVDSFWPEISEDVVAIETLSESSTLPAPSRSLAALVASKVYYHLGASEEALAFALAAGDRFEQERAAVEGGKGKAGQGFVEVILAKCIDTYIAARSKDPSTSSSVPDARLEQIVDAVLARCEQAGEWRQALGIALEARRTDVVSRIWETTKDDELLRWALEALAVGRGFSLAYKTEVLHLLLGLFLRSPSPDYFSITQIHIQLNEPSLSSALFKQLLTSSSSESAKDAERRVLVAYQVGFDLAEGATQEYLAEVGRAIPESSEDIVVTNLRSILSGEKTIRLHLDFLFKNNHADLLILKNTKEALESRSSMYHSAVTFANAFMNAGTTSDAFLRANLDWLGRASNWSKFSATAALGVLNKGHLAGGMSILGPYLPGNGASVAGASPYSEGGSLYALGLINAGRGAEVLEYLKNQLTAASSGGSEVVQHGAALGLGVAGMASGSEDVYDVLRETLFQDSAVAGEASGYAMGLVMLGTGSPKAHDEMIQYAHETQHEKIIRGLAMGCAFLQYGREEGADSVIESMLKEKDAILRYGGVYALGLAYAGTSSNAAVRKALDVAVSDVSDDVRRAAVTVLGFILFRDPEQVPRIVQLLAESYNPHVRQGAALALGISCAGTGLKEAYDLLSLLAKDPVDFVRQGALIALAMILIQQTEAQSAHVAPTRKLFAEVVGSKHEDALAKFGAALAQGILDAGGRNVTLSLLAGGSTTGGGATQKSRSAVVGMALFAQYWYWFPLAHALSLGFAPTAIIALDKDLKIPKMNIVAKGRPSLFAYPAPLTVPVKEEVKTVAAAVLSTTHKAQARAKEKKREEEAAGGGSSAMETDDKPAAVATTSEDAKMEDAADSSSKPADDAASSKATTTTAAAEPTTTTLTNLSRVTPLQAGSLVFPATGRYLPAVRGVASSPSSRNKRAPRAGIVLVYEQESASVEGEKEFIELEPSIDRVPAAAAGAAATAEGDAAELAELAEEDESEEREPPASFEFDFGA